MWHHFCGILLPKVSHGGQSRFKGRGFTEYTWQEAWVTGEPTLKTKTTAGQELFFFFFFYEFLTNLCSWPSVNTHNDHEGLSRLKTAIVNPFYRHKPLIVPEVPVKKGIEVWFCEEKMFGSLSEFIILKLVKAII